MQMSRFAYPGIICYACTIKVKHKYQSPHLQLHLCLQKAQCWIQKKSSSFFQSCAATWWKSACMHTLQCSPCACILLLPLYSFSSCFCGTEYTSICPWFALGHFYPIPNIPANIVTAFGQLSKQIPRGSFPCELGGSQSHLPTTQSQLLQLPIVLFHVVTKYLLFSLVG